MATVTSVSKTLALTVIAVGLPAMACARAQFGRRGSSYAQSVLQEVVQRHPEVKGMELAGRRGKSCVTIAATDAGDVGDACDDKEQRALHSGEPFIEEPSRKDPVYTITEALHDTSGVVVGVIITDIEPSAGGDRGAALVRARAIRREVESRIASAAQLSRGTPAAAPVPLVDASYTPRLDASTFASAVTNPYLPLIPGTTFRYRGTGAARDETNVVTVTNDTRLIGGIRATVVRDQVFHGDELTEDTYDWYAQDAEGNVWYLGEDTKEYRNRRVVSTKGSWEAGVNGGKAGIIMWADPAAHIGKAYRQEYMPGVAEDMGKVLSVREVVFVPFGRFEGCVKTEDTTPIEPNVREYKFYCRGIGVVKEQDSSTEGSELVAVERR